MFGIGRFWVVIFGIVLMQGLQAYPATLQRLSYPDTYRLGPKVFNGGIIGVSNKSLVAADLNTGALWSRSLTRLGAPSFFDIQFNQVFVSGDILQVYDANYGYLKWIFDADRIINLSLAYPYIVLEGREKTLYVLDFLTGQLKWKQPFKRMRSWSLDAGSRQLQIKTHTGFWSVDLSSGETVSQRASIPVSERAVSYNVETQTIVITEHDNVYKTALPTANEGYQFQAFDQSGVAISTDKLIWFDYSKRYYKRFDGDFSSVKDTVFQDALLTGRGRLEKIVLVGSNALYHVERQPVVAPKRKRLGSSVHPNRRRY